MSEFNPLVSIVIPVYNGSNYVKEAIDSALAQVYKNIEIIVVNDGSSDNGETEKIVQEYGDKVRYIYKDNGGVSTALNMGIKNMKGEYFSWLSHDDVYTEDKIQKSVDVLKNAENKISIVYCASVHIDKDSNVISKNKTVHHQINKFSWKEALMKLLREGSMNGCAFLIPKSVFENCGLFDERLRFNQDGFMWSKMFLSEYPLICLSDVCVKNRIHSKQLTQRGQSIFHRDCEMMSEYLMPQLLCVSNKNENFMMEYLYNNAKYGNRGIVTRGYKLVRDNKLISIPECLKLLLLMIYGGMRPYVRRFYYKVIRKINTT